MQREEATVVAAMGVEAWAVRRRAPRMRVVRAGIGLASLDEPITTPVALSVGLAGGLLAEHEPGTVVIPSRVGTPGGGAVDCDPAWVEALRGAARRLGYVPVEDPLATTPALVTDAERHRLAAQGFVAVDMESAGIAALASRVAVLRVILDTPVHEISPAWVHPARAALDPRRWREGAWLFRHGMRYALRAADVLADALHGDVDAEV
jgi:4-hydroxy-3-methylbut-2-en-1-yl diphosphate reductase